MQASCFLSPTVDGLAPSIVSQISEYDGDNDKDELNPTCIEIGWRIYMDY